MQKLAVVFLHAMIFLCLMSSVPAAGASGISIERAAGRTKEADYLMDARIRYELSDSVIEAVTHGIRLRFNVRVKVKKERNWIWDRTIKSEVLIYRLEYQPLSGNYIVTRLNDSEREQFRDLEEALTYLGNVNDYPLIKQDMLDQGGVYNCYIKSELKVSSLPLPLQPVAYLSPTWNLESLWYEWNIR